MTLRRAAVALALLMVVGGCGSGTIDSVQSQRLDVIRRATLVYRDPNAALAHGYVQVPGCVKSTDGSGALGTIFVKIGAPDQIDLARPQELFYDLEPAHGGPQLLGVGYVVRNTGQRPPSTALGHMDGPLPGAVAGQPSHFELHAWVGRRSPAGVLSFWNKGVSC